MTKRILILHFYILFIACHNTSDQSWQYLGEIPPGDTAKPFAHKLMNHLAHSYPTFSPDGKEMYWSEIGKEGDSHNIYFAKYEDGEWTAPTKTEFSGEYNDDQPFIAYDGQKLFFASKRPKTPGGEENLDLWWCSKTKNGWSEPMPVNDGIGILADLDDTAFSGKGEPVQGYGLSQDLKGNGIGPKMAAASVGHSIGQRHTISSPGIIGR